MGTRFISAEKRLNTIALIAAQGLIEFVGLLCRSSCFVLVTIPDCVGNFRRNIFALMTKSSSPDGGKRSGGYDRLGRHASC